MTVKVWPVINGRPVTIGVTPVELAISSRSIPLPVAAEAVPVLTTTSHVAVGATPTAVVEVIDSPVRLLETSVRVKLLLVTPLTGAANVTRYVTLAGAHTGLVPL